MKLYYSPGACSLSPHIVLAEAGLPCEFEKVDLSAKRTERGTDYLSINPKGYVPALELDDGEILTEGPAIVQYLADRVPEKQLAPPAGSMARYHLQEWLNFISEWKTAVKDLLGRRMAVIAKQLEGKHFITGDTFTVADAYLFTVLRWTAYVRFDLSPWPALASYMERVAARPAVQQALAEEGLISGS